MAASSFKGSAGRDVNFKGTTYALWRRLQSPHREFTTLIGRPSNRRSCRNQRAHAVFRKSQRCKPLRSLSLRAHRLAQVRGAWLVKSLLFDQATNHLSQKFHRCRVKAV